MPKVELRDIQKSVLPMNVFDTDDESNRNIELEETDED